MAAAADDVRAAEAVTAAERAAGALEDGERGGEQKEEEGACELGAGVQPRTRREPAQPGTARGFGPGAFIPQPRLFIESGGPVPT